MHGPFSCLSSGHWHSRQPHVTTSVLTIVFLNHHTGKAVNHGFAKELLAGLVGAEVDKLIETKGLDYVDRERAKHQAKRQAEHLYDQHYGGQDQYDP